MKEFIFLLRGGEANAQDFSQEELQKHVEKYSIWIQELIKDGHYIGAQPLEAKGKVLSGKKGQFVTDGPFAESKEIVGGYFLINAKDLEEATKIAKECPALENGGSVEIRPINEKIMTALKEK